MQSLTSTKTRAPPTENVVQKAEPRLPTYEEATGVSDNARLPSYNVKRSTRYCPYSRRTPIVFDDIDRLRVRPLRFCQPSDY